MKAQRIVVVQALDGGYNFGPAELKEALRSEEFGTYPTEKTAREATRRPDRPTHVPRQAQP